MDWRPFAIAQGRPASNDRTRAARLTWLSVVAASLSAVAAFALLPLAVQASVRALTLILDASVWMTVSLSRGDDWWTIGDAAARAVLSSVFSSDAAALVAALVLVAALALYGLQRLLGFDEESVP